MECWGAQGGDSEHTQDDGKGGKGGYAKGTKTLSSPNKLYVCVGQSGNAAGKNAAYNGGGRGYYSGLSYMYAQGGGATHIAITSNRGVLANYVNNKSEVLIVAGGGGGFESSGSCDEGSYGGGLTGGDGSYSEVGYNLTRRAKGGTQTSGGSAGLIDGKVTATFNAGAGSFGKGGDAYTSSGNNPGGAGGGGWYGGGGAPYAFGGGGGSSYIDGVTNGITIAGNATMPKPGGGTEIGHSGNGYCIITWHPE